MINHFLIQEKRALLEIHNISSFSFFSCSFYLDDQPVATFWGGNIFYLSKSRLTPGLHWLSIVAQFELHGTPTPIVEQHAFVVSQPSRLSSGRDYRDPDRDFKIGDILVASDNLDQKMSGYMGHSSLVISPTDLIECPGGHPAIHQDSIQQFLQHHPCHTHFRPKSAEMGAKAANYAKELLLKYQENLKNGIHKPIFSFDLSAALEDPWTYIYCSKLVWLSYNFGADYKFKNDFLWFSPEDLYENLKGNDHFELLYQHPDFGFKINT